MPCSNNTENNKFYFFFVHKNPVFVLTPFHFTEQCYFIYLLLCKYLFVEQ
jgi:hypothetical protein